MKLGARRNRQRMSLHGITFQLIKTVLKGGHLCQPKEGLRTHGRRVASRLEEWQSAAQPHLCRQWVTGQFVN